MLIMAVTFQFMIIVEGVTSQAIFHRSMIMDCQDIYQLQKQGLIYLAFMIIIPAIMYR